ILQVLTASDKAAAAAVAADKPSPLAPAESDAQEFPATPISRPQTPPEAITTEVPLTPVSEYTPSVEPKEKTKKSFLIKMRLIGRIVLEYLIDLFNRHSRDYREVSRKLSEMKSEEKINQHEERIRAQTTVATASVVNLNRMDHIDQFNDAIRTRTPSQPV
ncbi:unnamed protein product, partial [Adineta steineri]